MATEDQLTIDQPESIVSLDAVDFANRCDRWLAELQNCSSATRHESTTKDRARWTAILKDIKRKFHIDIGAEQDEDGNMTTEQIQETPEELDLPKYHPRKTRLSDPPTVFHKQNVDVMKISAMVIALRTEVLYSGASERVSGYSKAQAQRVEATLIRLGEILADIDANPEIDAPNSPDEKPK